jgi:hypothetical protein
MPGEHEEARGGNQRQDEDDQKDEARGMAVPAVDDDSLRTRKSRAAAA